MKIGLTRVAVVLLVLAVGAGGWYELTQRGAPADVMYRLGNVERGPILAVVVVSRTLNAVTTVQVGSHISGQVKEVSADFNSAVRQDQVIACIDPATFDLAVNRARADLDAANSAVAVARSTFAARSRSSASSAYRALIPLNCFRLRSNPRSSASARPLKWDEGARVDDAHAHVGAAMVPARKQGMKKAPQRAPSPIAANAYQPRQDPGKYFAFTVVAPKGAVRAPQTHPNSPLPL